MVQEVRGVIAPGMDEPVRMAAGLTVLGDAVAGWSGTGWYHS